MNLIHLKEVDSTNTYLKGLCRDGAAFGTVVFADNQLDGYGRYGRIWHHERDCNLAVSIALAKPADMADFEGYSMKVGKAVSKALSALTGIDFQIKWPNDILIDGRKVCGISCESIQAAGRDYIILGIGVNVNNTAFPDELEKIATSLYLQTNRKWDIREVLQAVLNEVTKEKNNATGY